MTFFYIDNFGITYYDIGGDQVLDPFIHKPNR